MKQFGIAALLLVGLNLIGCGSSNSNSNSNSNNVNGTWNATLVGRNKSTMFQFGTSLTADSDGILTISDFTLTTNSPCFADGETESGSVTLSGDFKASPSGKFDMMIQSKPPSGDTLMLSGTDNGNTILGNWALTGRSGCTGSGTFTMMKM
jgi:hypothetical protein